MPYVESGAEKNTREKRGGLNYCRLSSGNSTTTEATFSMLTITTRTIEIDTATNKWRKNPEKIEPNWGKTILNEVCVCGVCIYRTFNSICATIIIYHSFIHSAQQMVFVASPYAAHMRSARRLSSVAVRTEVRYEIRCDAEAKGILSQKTLLRSHRTHRTFVILIFLWITGLLIFHAFCFAAYRFWSRRKTKSSQHTAWMELAET